MYGLPYYERGIRAMYSEVTPYITIAVLQFIIKDKTLHWLFSFYSLGTYQWVKAVITSKLSNMTLPKYIIYAIKSYF